MSLALAGGAFAKTSGSGTNIPSDDTVGRHEITLHEEEISDVNLATFYVFDNENARTPKVGEKLRGVAEAAGAAVAEAAVASEAAGAAVASEAAEVVEAALVAEVAEDARRLQRLRLRRMWLVHRFHKTGHLHGVHSDFIALYSGL